MKWTPKQQSVIDANQENLLVSAAAGSGKTAVLVERILRLVTDPGDPVSVDRLMVMTFTRAAAEEMRGRIGDALRERIRQEPDNAWLRLQKAMLPRAKIATIDSICQNLIRQHYELLDLDPGFRAAEEGELKLLQEDVLKELLEECYQEGREAFLRLSEVYGSGRSDAKLQELILEVARFAGATPWPEDWLRRQEAEAGQELSGDLSGLAWLAWLFQEISGRCQEYQELLEAAKACCQEPDGPAPYLEGLSELSGALKQLEQIREYGAFSEFLRQLSFSSLKPVRGKQYDPEKKEAVKELCGSVRDYLKDLNKRYGGLDREALVHELQGTAPYLQELFGLTRAFMKRFTEKKREKNIVDFGDMEHLALELLYREQDGRRVPSELADTLAGELREILIDEYQDSNLVQEALIDALSAERFGRPDVFMVGDVKQSIYRFRLARPELFMEKYDSYPKEPGTGSRRIELNQNFRSRPEVLQAVNDVFFRLMQRSVGGIEYTEETALYPGAVFPETQEDTGSDYQTELWLLDSSGQEEAEAEMEEKAEKLELAGKLMAWRIRELLAPSGGQAPFQVYDRKEGALRPVRPGDIAVLLRAPGGTAEKLVDILEGFGVSAYTENASGYFSAVEVETMLSCLAVIDNPRQDIPLGAVLRSPVGGFSDQELAAMRAAFFKDLKERPLSEQPELANLYEALSWAAEEKELGPLSRKAADFLKDLERYRAHGDFMPVHRLLAEIYRESGYYAYVSAMPLGEKRRKNLDMLLERARTFGDTSYSGIFQFVRYIEQLRRYDTDYGEAGVEAGEENQVLITSIHKSKGLEYPVVMVAELDKLFNRRDLREQLLMDPELGVGSDYLDLEERVRYPGIKKEVIRQKQLLDSCGEELRILYVAMTRAREKLILMGTVKDAEKRIARWRSASFLQDAEKLPKSSLLSAGSLLDLLLMSLGEEPKSVRLQVLSAGELSQRTLTRQKESAARYERIQGLNIQEVPDPAYERQLSRTLGKTYAYPEETRLAPKQTVSGLQAAAEGLDYDDLAPRENAFLEALSEEALPEDALQEMPEDFPQAVEALRARLSGGAEAGAQRGSAYHRAFELLSFQEGQSAEEAVEAMVAGGRLSQEEAELLDIRVLDRFLQSPLGRRMAKAKAEGRLFREQRFMVGIPARELAEEAGTGQQEKPSSESLQLLQGIIDAYMENEDGSLTLIDYKTDRFYGLAPEAAKESLRQRYGLQLRLYRRALRQLLEKPVAETLIYSTWLSDAVQL